MESQPQNTEFMADFPYKVSLKILNLKKFIIIALNSNMFSVHLK